MLDFKGNIIIQSFEPFSFLHFNPPIVPSFNFTMFRQSWKCLILRRQAKRPFLYRLVGIFYNEMIQVMSEEDIRCTITEQDADTITVATK